MICRRRMGATNVVFLLLLLHVTMVMGEVKTLDSEGLSDFERRLDMSGLEVINKMYDNYDSRLLRQHPQRSPSDVKEITDESPPPHRVRRDSVILDQVKAAQKTGNREELYLRSSEPYKKLLEIYDPADIIPITFTLDPPFNIMEKPKFYAVANYRNNTDGSYNSAVLILRYNETTDDFTVHETLEEFAPYELESFSGKIGPGVHKNFLAVAGFIDDDVDRSMDVNRPQVSIYEISSPPYYKFTKIQKFRQQNVRAMKYIQIEQITYLIFGMYSQMSRMPRQYASPSQLLLLRFDLASNLFHFHSSLPGSGVTDIECFTIRGKTYLTVTNYRDNVGRLSILSFIYKYNEQIRGFEMMQYLSTNGARDIEHFTLANEEYIVVANEASGMLNNKSFNVDSEVYKFTNGRFELIQKLSTYGAVKWKSIAVPNCKQDVLLVYSDQRDNIDQIGIYTFSHDMERFASKHFSIYHLDSLNATFRPNVRALSAYSLQDRATGEYSLFLIIGARDVSQGNTIYKLTYEIILTDSPLDAFKRDVADQLNSLNATLQAVKALLSKAKATLADAVTKTGTTTITGKKTVMNNMVAEQYATINTLNITKGTMLLVKGNRTASEGSIDQLDKMVTEQNTTANDILAEKDNYMYTNMEQNVSAFMTFDHVIGLNVIVYKDIHVVYNKINNVDMSGIRDIVKKDEDTIISGYNVFTNEILGYDSIYVTGKVHGLTFPTDLVLQGITQNITAAKTFTTSVNMRKNVNTGTINGINVRQDALVVNRPEVVNGFKTFASSLSSTNASIERVNGIKMNILLNDRVTKSTNQTVTGSKTFQSITSNDEIFINGTINSIDVRELENKLKSRINNSVTDGEKVFTDNITITESLIIDEKLNSLSFPSDVLLKSSEQTVYVTKLFTNEIVFNNLTVTGKIDGMNLTDVVTLSTNQNISASKTFEDVTLTGDVQLADGSTINGIDVSEFAKDIVTITDKESIDSLTFADAVFIHNSTIRNLINNDNLNSLEHFFESCLHLHGDQNMTSHIKINNNITVRGNVNANYINTYVYPWDFASIHGNQTFYAGKLFLNDVTMEDVNVQGGLNGIDVGKFDDDIITDNGGTIHGSIFVTRGSVHVNGTLTTAGKINMLNFTEDLLFYGTDQDITAEKHFHTLDFSTQLVTIVGDVGVETTIDGVFLDQLELSGMTESKNETITGQHCFTQADYNTSVDFLNGIDLSALKDDIVTINTDQLIESEKVFRDILLERNLNTTSVVDGVDVSKLEEEIILSNRNSIIRGHVTFNQSLFISGNLTTKLINDVNMESIRRDYISLSDNVTLESLTVEGSVNASTLHVETINDINVDKDIVFRSKDQHISGFKEFLNISIGNLSIRGDINGVNLTALEREVVYIDVNQTIVGEKIFEESVIIGEDLDFTELMNGIHLQTWNIARTAENLSQIIEGVKSFTGNTSIKNMQVLGTVNNQNITNLFNEAVMANGNEIVEQVTLENGMNIDGNLTVNNSINVLGLINNVNITRLNEEVLKTQGLQNMTSKFVEGDIIVSSIILTGFVNGLNISRDLVRKEGSQTIRGFKEFHFINLIGNATVEKFVNGVNVTLLATNSLLKHTNYTQIINAKKSFENGVVIDYVTANQLFDELNITTSAFVTLHTRQIVYGRMRFTGDFVGNHTTVAGTLAGVNLASFNQSRVLLTGHQVVTSDIEFEGNVDVDGSISISKLVNNMDLYGFNRTSPVINETELGGIRKKLTTTLFNQCKSLTYVKEALKASAFHFDYFVERQSIRGTNIEHSVFFKIGNDNFMAYSVSRDRASPCASSIIARWNVTTVDEHQVIPTSGVMKMVFFQTTWNGSYLLVVNSKSGCPSVEGPLQLYKWNGTKFQLSVTLPTVNAVDAVVHQEANFSLLFISNANETMSSWLLTPSGIVAYSTLDPYPVTAHIFKINDATYLAVASRSQKMSSNGYVHLYKIVNGHLTKVQSIPTKGASSITSFTTHGITYLVIANDRAYSSGGHSTYYLTVDVYTYSDTKSFEWYRSLPAYRAYRVTSFKIGDFIYLSIVHFDQSISFYEFGVELGFQKVDQLYLEGVRGLTYMNVDEKRYVFISASSEVPPGVSKLIEISPSGPDQKKVDETIAC